MGDVDIEASGAIDTNSEDDDEETKEQ